MHLYFMDTYSFFYFGPQDGVLPRGTQLGIGSGSGEAVTERRAPVEILASSCSSSIGASPTGPGRARVRRGPRGMTRGDATRQDSASELSQPERFSIEIGRGSRHGGCHFEP